METLKRVLLLLLISLPLFAETQQRKTLLYLSNIGDFSNPERAIIDQTLRSSLTSQNTTQILQMNLDLSAEPETMEEDLAIMDQNAVVAGADSWIEIIIEGNRENISVRWILRDVQENQHLPGGEFQDSIDSSYLTLYGAFWQPVVKSVEEQFIPVEITGRVKIDALPGTEVVGIGEESLFIDQSGHYEEKLSAPGYYSVGLLLEGYYSEQKRFFLSKDEEVLIDKEQKKISNFSFKGSLYMLSFPSLAVNYQIPGKKIYAGVGLDLFFLGFVPQNHNNEDTPPSLFSGVGMFYTSLEAGYILETKKGLFRMPAGAGVFMRVTPYEETIALIDTISPWGFFLTFSLEYRIFRNISVFWEFRPTFYYTEFGDIYDEAQDGGPIIPLGDNLRFDWMIQLLGVRWTP